MKANRSPAIIAIDFDGTIVKHAYPKIGKLLLGAKRVINKLHSQGYTIIIWTCRGGSELEKTREFLNDNRIPFDKINENADHEQLGFQPFPKIYADFYIDDKNFGGFPGWDKINNYFFGEK